MIRKQIAETYSQIEALKSLRESQLKDYISTSSNYIYISDHALVRYIERVENILLLGNTDREKLQSFPTHREYRTDVLTKEEQKTILEQDKGYFVKNGYTYILRNLTLITIIKPKRKRHGNSNHGRSTSI